VLTMLVIVQILQANVDNGFKSRVAGFSNINMRLTVLVVEKHLTNIRDRFGARVENLFHVDVMLSVLVVVQKVLQTNIDH